VIAPRLAGLVTRAAAGLALRTASGALHGAAAVVRRLERGAERVGTRLRELEPGN